MATIKILGIEDTVKQMRKYQFDKIEDTKKIIKKTALKVKKDAQSKAPYLTGETKMAIGYNTYNGGLSMRVKPKKPKGYKAHWHEYGTSKMSARPFMTPAEKGAESEFRKDIDKLIKEEIKI